MSLYDKHMLSSLSLCKNKEVLVSNGGGEWERKIHILYLKRQYVALEHDTLSLFHVRVWKSIFLSFDHTLLKVYVLISGPILSQMLPSQMSCHQYVQEKSNLS